jgi:hypothetical protein
MVSNRRSGHEHNPTSLGQIDFLKGGFDNAHQVRHEGQARM